MNQQLTKNLAYSALQEMQRKVESYKQKPEASAQYVARQESYLNAIKDYFNMLEIKIQDLMFTPDMIVLQSDTVEDPRVAVLQQRIKHMEQLLKLKGLDESDQAYLLYDIKEITRKNSINRSTELWPELY